ncbi:LysR family transcriptional regulator [Pararoseomonas indoligenes]|uniref:LysR family transcriptional regulator n=1 Tax=Roseomonas indoligenes TaxID=2820811 RepID=A0A940N4D6_9PROT|nr:LysR family transcriptional regulator [Pararoseomonas indoligenes]MBP0496389.1 LysR family transcriptional regulator [Pararoseomonas indoligenes]
MKEPARTLAWDDFRLIDAVAATRNLPAAAARLGMDHSTVFRRLKAIEATLGQPLFERHRSGYTLTPAGEEMAALAARVDEDISAVTRRLAGQDVAPSGEVRLATSDSLLSDLLMPILVGFRAANPGIRLDIVTGNASLNLSRRDADVAVRATDSPPDTLVGRRAARIAWALYAKAEAEHPRDPAESAHWVCLGDNLSGLRVVRYAQAVVAPGRLAARFDTVLGLAHAVAAGIGVGHLPCFIGDAWPGLVRLAPPDPTYASDLWLLTHPDLRHTPRVRALLDHIAEAITVRRPLIEGAAPRGVSPGRD